jgi:aminoglycoside phosphotransferase (APT) family kinase protein
LAELSFETSVRDRIVECLGNSQVKLKPVLGGVSNLAFSVTDPAHTSPFAFVRCESSDGGSGGDRYGLRHEIAILGPAARLGFPVPVVLGTFEDPVGLVMAYVKGDARPDPETVEAVAPEYLALVARLHRVDPAEFGFVGPSTVHEAIADDLAWWEGRAGRNGAVDNLMVGLGRRLLAATIPHDDSPPCVVHGDVGAGNFMVDNGKVSAMLDWELAHVGDAHEDLAWLWMRGAHTDFGDPGRRLREYEEAAGVELDPKRLDWHLAFVMWKSCVALDEFLRDLPADQASLPRAVALLTYEALLGAQLVRLVDRSLQLLEGEPVVEHSIGVRLAERVLNTEELSTEARIAVEYLASAATHSAWVERERTRDLTPIASAGGESPALLVDIVDDGELADLTWALARDADRRLRAMPKAVRRVQRAQRIGLGTATRT